MQLDLDETKHNEQELEKVIEVLRNNLAKAKQFNDRFKLSIENLDEQLERGRLVGDKQGLAYE